MKEEAKKGAKGSNVMSGKALFKYDSSLFQDDEQAADEHFYDEIIDEVEETKEEDEKFVLNDANADAEYDKNNKDIVNGGQVNGKAGVGVDADLFKDAGDDNSDEEEPDFDS